MVRSAACGGPPMQIAPSGSTRGRGDQAADSGPAQVDPVRAVYRGENVCGSPACRRRAARAVPGINLRSINRAHISAISDPETFVTSALELRRNLTRSTGGLNGERTPRPDARGKHVVVSARYMSCVTNRIGSRA